MVLTQIARFMRPMWCPPGADRTQVGPCWLHETCYQGNATDTQYSTAPSTQFYIQQGQCWLIIKGVSVAFTWERFHKKSVHEFNSPQHLSEENNFNLLSHIPGSNVLIYLHWTTANVCCNFWWRYRCHLYWNRQSFSDNLQYTINKHFTVHFETLWCFQTLRNANKETIRMCFDRSHLVGIFSILWCWIATPCHHLTALWWCTSSLVSFLETKWFQFPFATDDVNAKLLRTLCLKYLR